MKQIWAGFTENLNNREVQIDNKPVYKYYLVKKTFDVILNINFRWPLLYMIIDGYGEYDCYRCTKVAPLWRLNCLWLGQDLTMAALLTVDFTFNWVNSEKYPESDTFEPQKHFLFYDKINLY